MNADERLEAVLGETAEAGLEAIIAVCGGVHAFQRSNAVFLLSGVRREQALTLLLRAAWFRERTGRSPERPGQAQCGRQSCA